MVFSGPMVFHSTHVIRSWGGAEATWRKAGRIGGAPESEFPVAGQGWMPGQEIAGGAKRFLGKQP